MGFDENENNGRSNNSPALVGLVVGLVFFIIGSGVTLIFFNQKPEKAAADVSAEQQPPREQYNSITQSFIGQGATACSAQINQVTNFLGTGGATGAFLFVPPSNPEKSMISSSLEIIGQNNSMAYATVTFAPNQANGCEAIYDAVTWWPQSCAVVANSQFPNQKHDGVLKQNIDVINLGPTTRVFLMPAGSSGCVSIKKEVVFQK